MSNVTEQAEPANKNDQPPPTVPLWPLAEILPCLFPAVIAALPVFLQAFFACMSGQEPPAGGYAPGDRHRCN